MLNLRNLLKITSICLFASINSQANELTDSKLWQVLENNTLGNNAFYNQVLASGLSLDVNKSDADRKKEINFIIMNEMDLVIKAFREAKEENKPEAVAKAINAIDPNIGDTTEATLSFTDGAPSSAYARTLLLIEKEDSSITADKVMKVLTSYRRSPKPSDYVYEYENPNQITQGQIKELQGSDTSWLMPEASPALNLNEDFVVKKCRQIMGWKCGTSLYNVGEIPEESMQYFFVSSYDLKNNPDHEMFTGDSRSKNQVAGSTSLFVVKESEKLVLIYGIDYSISNSKLSFVPLIREAQQKDFANLQKRLMADLELEKIVDQVKPKKIKLSLKDKIAKFFLKLKGKGKKKPKTN